MDNIRPVCSFFYWVLRVCVTGTSLFFIVAYPDKYERKIGDWISHKINKIMTVYIDIISIQVFIIFCLIKSEW